MKKGVIWGLISALTIVTSAVGTNMYLSAKQAEKHWIKATGSLYILNGMSYVCSAALLLLCMMSLAGGTYHPFIYFRF